MTQGKQFDVSEKTKILAWFHEGITPKMIAERVQQNFKAMRKVIATNKDLPVQATPPPAKKRGGCPRLSSVTQKNRLLSYLTAHHRWASTLISMSPISDIRYLTLTSVILISETNMSD
jgi:hypothetical protein